MLGWILLLACASGSADTGVAAPPPVLQEEDKEKEKPPEYPKLSALDKEKFKRIMTRFKNRNPEKRKEAELEMMALGRGVVPVLISKSGTRYPDQLECIFNSLAGLTDERDRLTLLALYDSKVERMRFLAVLKIAGMKREDQVDFLKKALDDKNEEIRLEAALGLAFLKEPKGIGEIIFAVSRDRKDPPPRLFEPLPNLKNKTYESKFAPYLDEKQDPEVRIAAVMVITGIKDKSLKKVLNRALYDPHNLVQTTAVNGLRELLDGEGPGEYNNIFELVEEVNKWKKRLGPIR